MVPKVGRFYGRTFQTERGVTQGKPVFPKIFNNVLYAGVRAVLMEVYGTPEDQNGLGWAAGEHIIVSYVVDVRIAGRKTIWVQTTLTAVVRIFERVGLQKNLGK